MAKRTAGGVGGGGLNAARKLKVFANARQDGQGFVWF